MDWPEHPKAIGTTYIRLGMVYQTQGADSDITDDDCYTDGTYNGCPAYSQVLERLRGMRVRITVEVLADERDEAGKMERST